MRGGLTAIQQTLTPEASSVLTHSISEAGRRNHGQTTPLHVAATLLASPTGFLRQACIRSHPNSSHPLQCRALELCFSVALERLPTTQQMLGSSEPPISNALMAALKRAQAHQRKGCPEQQQQPLLAVKVELEQLIISILDDPSVSRVMREASFSSPAVKSAFEQTINNSPSQHNSGCSGGGTPRIGQGFGLGFGVYVRPPLDGIPSGGGGGNRNLYLNPRLQQVNQMSSGTGGRAEDVKKVLDILTRVKKRNPILVGESEPRELIKEVVSKLDKEVILFDKEIGSDRLRLQSQLPAILTQLGEMIERKLVENREERSGLIVDLGDLKWLVDQPSNQGVFEAAREAVSEIGKILRKFMEGGSKIWLIGIATCETYLRCQISHPTVESEWDLQAVSIVSRPSSMPGIMPRLGCSGGILSTSIECLTPMKNFTMGGPSLTRRLSENSDPLRKFKCCPQCSDKYTQELAKLETEEVDKPSPEVKSDSNRSSLPPWLQNAKLHVDDSTQIKEKDLIMRQKSQELQKKWSQTCLQLHPSFHHNVNSERIIPSPISMTSLYNPNLLNRQPFQHKLPNHGILNDSLQLNIGSPLALAPPKSPVRTDLALGPIKKLPEVVQKECNNVPGDVDSFKRLLKGLIEKVAWQADAALAVASTATQSKSGKAKGDTWMLFSGPDRVGKKKMASALSELVCGTAPIVISLGSRRDGDETDLYFRGTTAIDRISEAVRRNPNSVILLQDIDDADLLVRGNIKLAMERGRFTDSHGREISLGNIIFIVTSTWLPHQRKGGLSSGGGGIGVTLNEEKLSSLASGGWELRISIGEKTTRKRSPPSWLNDDQERCTKPRKESSLRLSFDLNQMANNHDEDRLDGSHNSSDLTVEHEEENRGSPTTTSTAPNDMLSCVDEAIAFKPVDFGPIQSKVERNILSKFDSILGGNLSIKIEKDAIEKILAGVWFGRTTLESWLDKVLIPSIQQLKTMLPDQEIIARLELDQETSDRGCGDLLPSKISVVTDPL